MIPQGRGFQVYADLVFMEHESPSYPMKGRESGMPDEDDWASFFDADYIVEKLGCAHNQAASIVEFGCGYGTFTLPVAKRTGGLVYAFDIEADLIARVRNKALTAGLVNIRAEVRDFVTEGSGLDSARVDHAMLFNILHIDEKGALLDEAYRILRPGGSISIIHWNFDASTPRGPSMGIRPRPEQCRAWAESAGFAFVSYQDLSECCKYHYGMLLMRPEVRSQRNLDEG